MADVVLEVEQLAKAFRGQTALAGVSFRLSRGEVLAVVGPNGAGKSTLLRCIVGLARVDGGSVRVAGTDMARRPKEARRSLGYLPQEPAFPGDMTVGEAAEFFASLRQLDPGEPARALEEARLEGEVRKRVAELSGGMRRRLALAIAALGRPPLLILDEPASGLDVTAKSELREFIRRYRGEGRSVLFATHVLEDVPHVADRVLVLAKGRTVYLGPSEQLLAGTGESIVYVRSNGASGRVEQLLRELLPRREVRRLGEWVAVACTRDEKLGALRSLLASGLEVTDVRTEEAPVEETVRLLTEGGES